MRTWTVFPQKFYPRKEPKIGTGEKKLSLRIVAAGSLSPYIVLMSHLDRRTEGGIEPQLVA